MKKLRCFILCVLFFKPSMAQHLVRFIVNENTSIKHSNIYVAGTFNNWDSTPNKKYLLQPYSKNQKSIVLNILPGNHLYKFHRGSWFTVEKQYNAGEVPDRQVSITKDITLNDFIWAWRDEIITDKKHALSLQRQDSSKVKIMAAIANVYAFWPEFYNADSANHYAHSALLIQQKIISAGQGMYQNQTDFNMQLWSLQDVIASLLHSLGNYPKSLELRFENLKLAEKEENDSLIFESLRGITSDYSSMKDYENVLQYGKRIESIGKNAAINQWLGFATMWTANHILAKAYYKLNKNDSALYYARKMNSAQVNTTWPLTHVIGNQLVADIYAASGNIDSAFLYYRKSIPVAASYKALHVMANLQAGMARLFHKTGHLDSALLYARQALVFFQTNKVEIRAWGDNNDTYVAEISPLVAQLYYANGQLDSAYKYLLLSVSIKDSLYNIDKIRQFQTLGFNEAAGRQQLEQERIKAKKEYETKIQMYGLTAIITAVVILAFILYRNNKHKQRANNLLLLQKHEIEKTLKELKQTQYQLVQSEKMASLGELTAGIAHEIQNPLNFVNNFSELNEELLDELKAAVKNNDHEALVAVTNDIKSNLQKISHHGKRADAIVKGMLLHSRNSNGMKEPTDINALADEYLRLSYHGMRAKDKSFVASTEVKFDETIGTVTINAQDVGRVLLNLFTNAFYAVLEKKMIKQEDGFTPLVSVSTKKESSMVVIRVKDNGNGIPEKIADKIFQPFFTTKPSGQGTGLGLSMSYDIIKAQGGQLKVDSIEGEGAEFIIELPLT